MTQPLVSAIMPARGRRAFAEQALACWRAQTYPRKQLVILDDMDKPAFRDGVQETHVLYAMIGKREVVGAKRNLCCSFADGEIIVHFDSDDYSAPERIAKQVERLQVTGKAVTGFHAMKFTDGKKWWQYQGAWVGFAFGASLCYLKSWWESHHFAEVQSGQDEEFALQAAGKCMLDSRPDYQLMYATNHAEEHADPQRRMNHDAWVELPEDFVWSDGPLERPHHPLSRYPAPVASR